MSTQLNPLSTTQIIESNSLTLDQQARINKLLEQSKSSNTIDAYQSDWSQFTDFCSTHNHQPLPAATETILLYISELTKEYKFASIKRKISSINKAHTTLGYPSPTYNNLVKDMMDGVKRAIGSKQTPKKALILDDLKLIIDAIDVSTLAGVRDKALLLCDFATASRCSEVVYINVDHVTFTPEGMDIDIYEEKTKSYITKSVLRANNNYCPVVALQQWLTQSQITSNAVFRSINKVGKIGERLNRKYVRILVKQYCERAGLDPSLYASHSLRSGMATSAAEEGFTDSALMKQTGHKSRNTLDRYVQNANRYKNNVTSIFGKL